MKGNDMVKRQSLVLQQKMQFKDSADISRLASEKEKKPL